MINENRLFHSAALNTTIWYFHWFGEKSPLHSHFNITQDVQQMDCMPSACGRTASTHSWIAFSAAEFVHEFILAHSPHLVVLNRGHHGQLDGKNAFSNRESALEVRSRRFEKRPV